MHARKYRYDESFVDKPSTVESSYERAKIEVAGSGRAEYVPSPARELQRELTGRLQKIAGTEESAHFSRRSNMLIITGISILLWTGLLAIGWTFGI